MTDNESSGGSIKDDEKDISSGNMSIDEELFTIAGGDKGISSESENEEKFENSSGGVVTGPMEDISSFRSFDPPDLGVESSISSFDGLRPEDIGISDEVFQVETDEPSHDESEVDEVSEFGEIPESGFKDYPEELTKPGILRRNTTGNVVKNEPEREDSSVAFTDTAEYILDKHKSGFSGIMKVVSGSSNYILWWYNGLLGDIDNYGGILSDILKSSGFDDRVVSDLAKPVYDPLEIARRRHLIRDGDENNFLAKCRQKGFLGLFQENVKFSCDSNQSFSLNFRLPLIHPIPLIIKGVVENYHPALSYALGNGEEPGSILESQWNEIKHSEFLDPLWVRTVELFRGGKTWKESSVYGGISEKESENLLYSLRLTSCMNPPVKYGINHYLNIRTRFYSLMERINSDTPEEFFEGTDAKARSNYRELLLFLAEMPLKMQNFIYSDIVYLKKEMERKLQEVT
ncbi:MAG: hypothetical protein JXR95_05655 [Deltaproteobacteria bacterium]|nr:hypothetical protein [Deltaproteobacteria bacterium]